MKRLALLLLPAITFAAAPSGDWSPNVTAGVAWQTNASNGEASWDRIGAVQLTADALSSAQYELGPSDTAHLSGHLLGDWFPRFQALARAGAGLRADWQHRFGRDAWAPVFTVEGSGDGIMTVESARRGTDGAVTLNLRQKIGAQWRAALSERFDRYAAHRAVFDSRSNETALEISRDLNDATRLVVTGRWRDGDVVTYAQYDRPDLAAIARARAALTTFHRRMTAYATDARTIAGRVALVHATSDESAMILAYEYARTSRTDLRFANQTISLSLVRQY